METLVDEFHPHRHKCRVCGGEIWYNNAKIQKKNGKITGTSFNSTKIINNHIYKLQVCENCMHNLYPDQLLRYNVMSELTKFAFDISEDDYKLVRSKYALTISHMKEKYGEEEGQKRWDEYVKKQAYTNSFEYKNNKFGWSKEEYDEYNASRSITLSHMKEKYGEEEGQKRWDEYVKKQAYTKSKEYIVGKYGEERWNLINSQKKMSLENMIRLYGDKGRDIYDKRIKNRLTPYSFISQQCFEKLEKLLPYDTLYASKNREVQFTLPEIGNVYLDFFVPQLNICIEFNGDAFHGNPDKFKPNEHCFPYNKEITALQLQENDKRRYKLLEQIYHIKTYVIWESEYKKGLDLSNFINEILIENGIKQD